MRFTDARPLSLPFRVYSPSVDPRVQIVSPKSEQFPCPKKYRTVAAAFPSAQCCLRNPEISTGLFQTHCVLFLQIISLLAEQLGPVFWYYLHTGQAKSTSASTVQVRTGPRSG